MDNESHELELKFDDPERTTQTEFSGEATESVPQQEYEYGQSDDSGYYSNGNIEDENSTENDAETYAADAEDPKAAEPAAAAAAMSDSAVMLSSRHPSNRPAGTPPLENSYAAEPMTAMEMVVAGKSFGTALRILREQHNMSYEELEQVTRIQARFLEALENENLAALPPLVYAIGFIRTLSRVYKLSNSTSQQLVAKLKEQLEYSCNDELMNTLDIDCSGMVENERRLKRFLTAMAAAAIGLIGLIVLLIVCFSSCGDSRSTVATESGSDVVTVSTAEGFDPKSIDGLLKAPTLEMPKLPVAE